MNKTVSTLVTILCLLSAVFLVRLAFNTKPVEASGDVNIMPDGSVEPSNAPIHREGDFYTFTDNIYDSIAIGRDNIIVDGNGYTLQGSDSDMGITLYAHTQNVILQNMNVKNFDYGIYLISEYNNITLAESNITSNACGIYLSGSSNNTISRNNITDNYWGVRLCFSSNNNLFGNNITANNSNGVWLEYYNYNNSIYGNNITANTYEGIKLERSSNNSISGNNIAANKWGIDLASSSNNTIIGNNVENNQYGISLSLGSYHNILSRNNITTNTIDGVYLDHSPDTIISGNNITNNRTGISLGSLNCTISGNNVINNDQGANLWSSGSRIYNNSFIENNIQVYVAPSLKDFFPNSWDNGYASGGNYWSDFKERYPEVEDVKSGPNQDQSGSDGIWDHPYVIDKKNQDNYPIVPEFPSFLILPPFMIATLLAVIVYRRKHCD
jgi:parallel beta-helix repeat protein